MLKIYTNLHSGDHTIIGSVIVPIYNIFQNIFAINFGKSSSAIHSFDEFDKNENLHNSNQQPISSKISNTDQNSDVFIQTNSKGSKSHLNETESTTYPMSKTLKALYPIVDNENKQIGIINLLLRLTCYGPEINLDLPNNEKNVLSSVLDSLISPPGSTTDLCMFFFFIITINYYEIFIQ